MAQIRDSRTSALLYEGTPAQVAAIADQMDPGDYLFDDVGLEFDAPATLEIAETHIAFLREVDAEKADEAQAPLDEARSFDVAAALDEARSE